MRTALILGAGATLDAAADIGPSDPKFLPPLDKTFFQQAASFAIRVAPGKNLLDLRKRELEHQIRQSSLFRSPWEDDPPPMMEMFFSEVFYEVWNESANAELILAVLLRLYSALIAQTTNWLVHRDRPSRLGRLIGHLLDNQNGDELTIITFNQDLVVENELLLLSDMSDRMTLLRLYGREKLTPIPGWEPEDEQFNVDFESTEDQRLNVTLLKVHGSLNWMLDGGSRNQPRSLFFPEPDAPDRAVHLVKSRLVQPEILHRSGTQGHPPLHGHFWPLVVPPIYDKNGLVSIGFLRSVWAGARDALTTADRVVAFGYSLPDTDVIARLLIKRSIATNSGIGTLDCINPDNSVATKFRTGLGLSSVDWYPNIDEYLAQ